jgi:hypothetical protein
MALKNKAAWSFVVQYGVGCFHLIHQDVNVHDKIKTMFAPTGENLEFSIKTHHMTKVSS